MPYLKGEKREEKIAIHLRSRLHGRARQLISSYLPSRFAKRQTCITKLAGCHIMHARWGHEQVRSDGAKSLITCHILWWLLQCVFSSKSFPKGNSRTGAATYHPDRRCTTQPALLNTTKSVPI
jgi:hypothetical protein